MQDDLPAENQRGLSAAELLNDSWEEPREGLFKEEIVRLEGLEGSVSMG